MDIKDRVFLITGAASGLGSAVARMIVRNGGSALLLDRNEEAGASLSRTLGSAAQFLRTDVTSDTDGRAAIAAAIEMFGRIDGLVNCAGTVLSEKIVGRDGPHLLEHFSQTISVNLLGTFNMLRLVAGAIAKQEPGDGGERGVIINTASVAAYDGQIGQASYAASKGGVVSMTLPSARELARYGIRVVAIAPGIFETPMMTGMPQNVQDALQSAVPFPARFGRPDEYADLVRHIIENQMLNGAVIRLDGALRMASR